MWVFKCLHCSSVLPPSPCLPAKGPEKSFVCVEQTVLCHRWGSLPDHRQRSGLLPPDLPAGCCSGDWQETHKKRGLLQQWNPLLELENTILLANILLRKMTFCITGKSCRNIWGGKWKVLFIFTILRNRVHPFVISAEYKLETHFLIFAFCP